MPNFNTRSAQVPSALFRPRNTGDEQSLDSNHKTGLAFKALSKLSLLPAVNLSHKPEQLLHVMVSHTGSGISINFLISFAWLD